MRELEEDKMEEEGRGDTACHVWELGFWEEQKAVLIESKNKKKAGPLGESNPRPPPPEGGIIPLDQAAITYQL